MFAVQPITDRAILEDFYRDPYIAKVGHDDRPAAFIDHPAVKYLGAYKDDQLLGAFLVIESGFVEKDVHALLTRAALPYSRTLGTLCIAQMFTDKHTARVSAYVIDGLTAARNYCLKLGFKSEGYRRNACRKDGKLIGVHVLGMTRQDWEKM